jgi:hypothetical protein
MKMSTATAIFALAALAAPAAVGQSHLPFHPMHQAAAATATEMVQVATKTVLPWSSSRSFDLDGNLSSSGATFPTPSPGTSWLPRPGFLGLVAIRRTRGPSIR